MLYVCCVALLLHALCCSFVHVERIFAEGVTFIKRTVALCDCIFLEFCIIYVEFFVRVSKFIEQR